MSDKKEPSWECPTCQTEFGKHSIAGLINKIEVWLADRPSASMDCNPDKTMEMYQLLHELKSLHITYIRKPTRMMESQNAIGENKNDLSV